MKRTDLIKLLRAMAESTRATAQEYIKDLDPVEDKFFGNKLLGEALALEDAARLIENNDYANRIWKIYFPDHAKED